MMVENQIESCWSPALTLTLTRSLTLTLTRARAEP